MIYDTMAADTSINVKGTKCLTPVLQSTYDTSNSSTADPIYALTIDPETGDKNHVLVESHFHYGPYEFSGMKWRD